ncbi:hypothetical protein [Intestinibacter sp.]|uniref:hypothetical protein n=1 Tax=Intestinibacter sp. TaxID=1965304 RepID=UPI003F160D41
MYPKASITLYFVILIVPLDKVILLPTITPPRVVVVAATNTIVLSSLPSNDVPVLNFNPVLTERACVVLLASPTLRAD